jgi:hypothetical protein
MGLLRGRQMRAGSRFLAVILASAVWIYAGMSVASRPLALQAITPTVLDATTPCALAAID